MNSTYQFFRRYPLLIAGTLFLAGQLLVGEMIVIAGRRHSEIAWVLISSVAICSIALFFSRRWFRFAFPIVALFAGLSSQAVTFPTHLFETSQNVRGEFQVMSLPKRKVTQQVTFIARSLDEPLKNTRMRITATELPWRSISGVRKGDLFKGVLKCRASKDIRSIVSFEYTLLRKGIASSCRIIFAKSYWSTSRKASFIENLRSGLPEMHQYRLEYGLLLSLIFGIDSELPFQLEKSFKRTGLTHLLVFSGAQTSIIYVALSFIMRGVFCLWNRFFYIGYTRIFEVALGFVGTILFCSLIGFESATMRAIVASGLVVFSSIKETNQGMLYRMFLSLIILAAIWPGCFLEPGVQLTYAALLGIWWGLRFKNKVTSYLQMSFAISALTNTVTFLWFGSVSFAGIFLNPILAPAVSLFSVFAGIPAVMAIYLGFMELQWFPQTVFWCLSHLESLVFWVSRFDWAYYTSM